jgi:hypothetical protein
MGCTAISAGLLQDCTILNETPVGDGFGAAALSLAAGMELKSTAAGSNARLFTPAISRTARW